MYLREATFTGRYLYSQGLLEAYHYNVAHYGHAHTPFLIKIPPYLEVSLDSSFHWRSTPEGFDFWNELDDVIARKLLI